MRPGHLNLQSIAQQVDKLLFIVQISAQPL